MTSKIRFRVFSNDELSKTKRFQIKRLQSECFNIQCLNYIYEKKPSWLLAEIREGRNLILIACAAFRLVNTHEVYMSDFCVSTMYRGRGIGRSVLDILSTLCKNSDKVLMWEVYRDDLSALKFYERCGYYPLSSIPTNTKENRKDNVFYFSNKIRRNPL